MVSTIERDVIFCRLREGKKIIIMILFQEEMVLTSCLIETLPQCSSFFWMGSMRLPPRKDNVILE
jgi:hypothetical protein